MSRDIVLPPKLKELVELYEFTKKALAEKCESMVPGVINEFFESNKGINTVIIKGYTPSFNDGEPCVHNQYIELSNSDVAKFAESHFDTTDLKPNIFLENDQYGWRSGEKLDALEPVLYDIHGTDWAMLITRENHDAGYNLKKVEYNPGY